MNYIQLQASMLNNLNLLKLLYKKQKKADQMKQKKNFDANYLETLTGIG